MTDTHTPWQRGRRAGERGVPRDIPHDLTGREATLWLEGYDSCFGECEGEECRNDDGGCYEYDTENTILDRAKAIITGNRQTVNGKPERSFHKIAERWSLTTGHPITAQQVALMMVDLKMVRALEGVTTEGQDDHFVDMAGYIALAAELGE